MAIEIMVPALGESVTEATVGQWFKKPGDAVNADEPLVELETDKVTVEVPAPAAGVLADIKVAQGTTVAIGSVLGSIRRAPDRRGRSRAARRAPASQADHAAARGGQARRQAPAPSPRRALSRAAPERGEPRATCRPRPPPAS